jgi:hypothetical protein
VRSRGSLAPWEPDGDEPLEKLVHALAPEGHLATDRHAFAQLEGRDGPLRLSDQRFLTGDVGQLLDCHIEELGVPRRFADADVAGHLFDPRHLHGIRQSELLLELWKDLF